MHIRDRLRKRPELLAVLLTLAGCGKDVTLEDDMQPDTGRRAEDDDGDVLNAPYASGSSFTVKVRELDAEDCEGLSFESDDPAIVRVAVDEEDPCLAHVDADAPGETVLRVLDGDEEVHAVDLEVAAVASATIHPRGMLLVGMDEAFAPWESARMVEALVATFTVRWWDADGRELSAKGVLETTISDGLVVGPPMGRGGSPDWLQVRAAAPGSYTADVGTDGEILASIDLEVVAATDVTSLDLVLGQMPGDDDRAALLALGRDDAGDPVLGLQPTWTAGDGPIRNDEGVAIEGDLFVFNEGGTDRTITADSLGLANSTEVSMRGDPSVDSSNGCSGMPGLPAPAGAFALLALALGVVIRRRRLV